MSASPHIWVLVLQGPPVSALRTEAHPTPFPRDAIPCLCIHLELAWLSRHCSDSRSLPCAPALRTLAVLCHFVDYQSFRLGRRTPSSLLCFQEPPSVSNPLQTLFLMLLSMAPFLVVLTEPRKLLAPLFCHQPLS